jgi:V/A-type H+-transporting ATPase subunit I
MKKVCLIVQDKVQEEALTKLREIGVVHLEKKDAASAGLSKALERKARVENALNLLRPFKAPKQSAGSEGGERRTGPSGRRATDQADAGAQGPYSLDAIDAPARPDLAALIGDVGREIKALRDRQVFLVQECTRVQAWGEFDPRSVQALAEKGLPLFFYELTPADFAVLPEDVRYIRMGEDKSRVYIVVFGAEIPGVSPFVLPEKSLAGMRREQEEIRARITELEGRLERFVDRRPHLVKEMAAVQQDIDFEAARGALERIDDIPPQFACSYLMGYAPQEDIGVLKRAAAEHGWAFWADDPGPDDPVPTKLKNNRLVSLLYPLTDFLEVVPGYNEVDITGWFLLFFCVFFGMIFGDAGYGLLLFFIALIGILKTAKKGVPAGLKMLMLLSISNTVWGVLTCTWFGVEAATLPQIFKDISLPFISGANPDEAYVSQNLQVFCFSLALLQLSIAHLKGIMRNIKSLKVLGEVGSLAMLWGIYPLVLYLVVSSVRFPFLEGDSLNVVLGLVGGGFALGFIFANYEGSIGRSIVTSLKNIISVVLGVTNVFSDIMSYIRLWAVGLAGASISATVNTMAGPLLGNFLVFLGIILLVFGHGLNIVLNVLSVLVHGVRLNTLEFSGHIGLTWSGTAYRPFAETARK